MKYTKNTKQMKKSFGCSDELAFFVNFASS